MTEQISEREQNTVNIYGMDVPLGGDIRKCDMVTDVIILTRYVHFDDDGRPRDGLIVNSTKSTTRMITMGMSDYFRDMLYGDDYDID